jgi:hypothetical protein
MYIGAGYRLRIGTPHIIGKVCRNHSFVKEHNNFNFIPVKKLRDFRAEIFF